MAALSCALVTPLTGPLERYGRAGAAALRLWAERAADLPPAFGAADLTVYDAHPDPADAVRRATADNPHILFGPYGSGPAIAVAGATSRLVWNHGGASSRLAWGAFPNVVNVLAPASSYFTGTLLVVRAAAADARTVRLVHATTGFANDVATGAAARAHREGYTVRSIPFEAGRLADGVARVPDGDVLLVVGGFDDELAAARALLPRPWPAAGFVGAGVDDVLAPLEDARAGLLGPAQWTAATAPKPDEGPDAAWFVSEYVRATGGAPPYPAAQAFACGLIAARCLRDAGVAEDAALLRAATELRCTTFFGDFAVDADSGLQIGHEVLTVQWQAGARRVVWPPQRAQALLVYPRRPMG